MVRCILIFIMKLTEYSDLFIYLYKHKYPYKLYSVSIYVIERKREFKGCTKQIQNKMRCKCNSQVNTRKWHPRPKPYLHMCKLAHESFIAKTPENGLFCRASFLCSLSAGQERWVWQCVDWHLWSLLFWSLANHLLCSSQHLEIIIMININDNTTLYLYSSLHSVKI